ncbi:MAG: UDP-glucose/GDP-mannose dehydrogenase family protein [Candidatus Omnitrophota bacterium]|jgi:UDPglucose 6-dehydrogenase
MYTLSLIGAGYVGLVTAACFAELGYTVFCVDNDKTKIRDLKKGIIPLYEPGLAELITRNRKQKRLFFAGDIKTSVRQADIVFICVGTPSRPDGSADLSAVEKVASEIARSLKKYTVIVEKSTVPAETGEKIARTIEMNKPRSVDFDVVSNPEFLREGQAIKDTLRPGRIVIGVESKRAENVMRELYKPIKAPLIVTNINTAEIIKHASNSFLAAKISFINAVAGLCDRLGADVEKVADAMGLDKRIGRAFLNAGAGFGGSCFPKDVDAFIHLAQQKGYDFELLKTVRKINHDQRLMIVKKIEEALWIIQDKTIAVLGLSFKPETDDIRSSVSIEVIKLLVHAGARIKAYDPQAMPRAQKELKHVFFCKNEYEAADNADCLLIMTEWKDFRSLDLMKIKRMLRQPVIVDGRNILDPDKMRKIGFIYKCVGRGIS